MFINDLCNVIRYCHKWHYVDDVKMVGNASTQTPRAHVHLDLNAISKWSEENLLLISIPKCAILNNGLRTLNCQYNICGQQITAVKQCIDLGVLKDGSFSCDVHIHNAALKSHQTSGYGLEDIQHSQNLVHD